MQILIPLLFLPAICLWLLAVINLLRATQNVRHDQNVASRMNPVIWLSEWRTKATFTEDGQRQMAFAKRMRKAFLLYCVFLLIVLLSLPRVAPEHMPDVF
jgi:hypothetical protein